MSLFIQVRSLDMVLHPERLKVITQQVQEEQAHIQTQTLLRLQQLHAETSAERDRHAAHSPQVQRHTGYRWGTQTERERHTQSTDGETHQQFLNGRNVLFSFLSFVLSFSSFFTSLFSSFLKLFLFSPSLFSSFRCGPQPPLTTPRSLSPPPR